MEPLSCVSDTVLSNREYVNACPKVNGTVCQEYDESCWLLKITLPVVYGEIALYSYTIFIYPVPVSPVIRAVPLIEALALPVLKDGPLPDAAT